MQYPQRTLFPFVRNAVSCRKFSLQQCDKSLDTLCTVLQSYRAICFCNQDTLSDGIPCMSCVTQQSLQDTLSSAIQEYVYICNRDGTLSCVTEQLFYVTRILCPQAFGNIVYIFNQDGTVSCVTEQSIYVTRKLSPQAISTMPM
jgi:hypothetical protein